MKATGFLSKTFFVGQLIAVGLSLAALPPGTAAAQVSGNCETTATKFKWGTTFGSTTSTTYVNMPEMGLTITQGATGCVIVQFAASVAANAGQTMIVRARLDDVFCGPVEQIFITAPAGTAAGSHSHAMNFVCQDVAPGDHTIRMQYRSFSGGQVIVNSRSILVQYVP